MATETKKQSQTLENVLDELKDIKKALKKLLLLIPEESLKEYENSGEIQQSFQRAVKNYPPV
jgi:predicted  nucleic acid-binding Zn-ribbon protein